MPSDNPPHIPPPPPSDAPLPENEIREEDERNAQRPFDPDLIGLDRDIALRQRTITKRNLWVFVHVVPWLIGLLIVSVLVISISILVAWAWHILMPTWHWIEHEDLSEARYFALLSLALALLSGAGIRYSDIIRQKLQLWL